MGSYRTTIFCILAAISAFSRPAAAQVTQDAFSTELIAACQNENYPKIRELIHAHRLWVKPVVNQLISDYINRTMMGNRGGAQKKKEAATLIAQTFLESYGEKSLSIATSYLDTWTMEQMGKKAQADRIFDIATDLRKGGQQMEEAKVKFLQSLDLYTNIGDIRGQGEVLGGLGFIYWSIDSDTCLSYYRKALQAREQVDDRVLTGASLNSIGLVYFQHYGNLDSARCYLEVATRIREEIGDLPGLGSSLGYLAMVYEYLGELESANQCYKQSYTVHQVLGLRNKMADSKFRTGCNLQLLGKYPEALQNLETAEEIYLTLGDTINLADVYTQLGLVYENIGDYDTAIEYVTKASGLYLQIDELWGLAGAYNHTGIILHSAGRKQRASEFYLKALEIYQELDDLENVVTLLTNLGAVNLELNNLFESDAYNQKGLKISREIEYKAGELPCLINLANVQNRLNQLDTALINYELALKLSKELGSPDNEWRIMVGIAENYKLKGNYAKSIEYNEKGLTIIEELRNTLHVQEYKSTYLARERYAFEDVIHMLGQLHESDPNKGYDLLAFEYAQRCKSRSFLEQIKGSEPVTIKEVQDAGLDKNCVILEYSLGDSSSTCWVITPDAYQMIRLPSRKSLEEQIETFRFAILNPDQDNKTFLQQSGYFLYKQLFQPAEDFLSKKSQLVILPDGILHYIPFEVLITSEPAPGSDKPYGKLSYLGKTSPISYGQSASVYLSMVEDRSTSGYTGLEMKELVAFGDPVYGGKFKRLEYSGEEIENIAALFPEAMVKTFIREEATEEHAKEEKMLSEYRHIHFATHGVMDEKNPEKSGLVLSRENLSTEDGVLRADEISGLELNADLVVLSACQTGIGKMIRGEGMIGLSRSFIYAGAPSVVMSLWSVADQSTSILMKRFYENLIDKKQSKAVALQQARISMIKDEQYAHPFFWAPFVLTGDWQ